MESAESSQARADRPRVAARRRLRWNYEHRLLAGIVLVASPALAALAAALGAATPDRLVSAAAWTLVTVATLGLALALKRRAVYPLYTLSNLLEALREGDYSLRGSRARRGDAVGEVVREINALAQTLREQRIALEERGALLSKVVAAMDSAILSFDADGRLDLANPAALQLLGITAAERSVADLGLAGFLDGDVPRVVEHVFPGAAGRWEVRHARFRENGKPHDLLVISDLGRALREEERVAWQRLLRVLGHELNNSLAPIRSMADTLARLVDRTDLAGERGEDLRHGLHLIGNRAEALARFMSRYTQLARLPPPTVRTVDFGALAQRVAGLELRIAIALLDSPETELQADPDQLEQVLINLLQNATDAALDGGGHVDIGWKQAGDHVLVEIRDDGPGLPPSDNLFVPFFTTKPGGSGIGLVLARQIVEAHGGAFTLEDRLDAHGSIARLRLPSRTAP